MTNRKVVIKIFLNIVMQKDALGCASQAMEKFDNMKNKIFFKII